MEWPERESTPGAGVPVGPVVGERAGSAVGVATPRNVGEALTAGLAKLPGGGTTSARLAASLDEGSKEAGMHGRFLPRDTNSVRRRISLCAWKDAPQCQDAVTT